MDTRIMDLSYALIALAVLAMGKCIPGVAGSMCTNSHAGQETVVGHEIGVKVSLFSHQSCTFLRSERNAGGERIQEICNCQCLLLMDHWTNPRTVSCFVYLEMQ